jgi:hypothetical protein
MLSGSVTIYPDQAAAASVLTNDIPPAVHEASGFLAG